MFSVIVNAVAVFLCGFIGAVLKKFNNNRISDAAMGEHKWAALGKETKRFSVPSSVDMDKIKKLFNGF